MRALAWNTAMPVLEAGIEEALTHLNRDSNSPTANYWTADQVNGQAVYWKYRALPDGSYFYVTNFNVASPSPIIQSAGYVRSPLSDNQYISRVVQVTATNPPSLFGRAIAATPGHRKCSGPSAITTTEARLKPARNAQTLVTVLIHGSSLVLWTPSAFSLMRPPQAGYRTRRHHSPPPVPAARSALRARPTTAKHRPPRRAPRGA